jgi:hypothetical protein
LLPRIGRSGNGRSRSGASAGRLAVHTSRIGSNVSKSRAPDHAIIPLTYVA